MTQTRIPNTTITLIDNYCSAYQELFPEVRSYEAFKRLQTIALANNSRNKKKNIRPIRNIIWVQKNGRTVS